MSRAFVKETDDSFESLPDRPISPHQNLVTPEGLALIEAALARLRQERTVAHETNDRAAQARIDRDLRYWTSRHSTAQVIRAPQETDVVRFGSTVTIARDDERRASYRIVGEDEADPAKGSISYVSPLAQALLGKRIGDSLRAGKDEAEITAIA